MRLVYFILFSLFTFYCSAQKFQSGIITGISASQVSGDNLSGFKKAGIQLGGYVNYPFNESASAQFSLYYIDKGSNDPKTNFQIDLSYIETSWSILYDYQGFVWEAGLLWGILRDGKTFNYYGVNPEMSDFENFDIGAKFSLGRQLMPKLFMFWEYSNTIPFFPIQKHPATIQGSLNKGKMNSVLCFSFRYLLNEK